MSCYFQAISRGLSAFGMLGICRCLASTDHSKEENYKGCSTQAMTLTQYQTGLVFSGAGVLNGLLSCHSLWDSISLLTGATDKDESLFIYLLSLCTYVYDGQTYTCGE